MSPHLVRFLGLSGLFLNLLAGRESQAKILLPLDEPPALECNENDDGLTRESNPWDAWVDPYEQGAHAFLDQYGASGGLSIGAWRVPTSFDWWSRELTAGRRFRVADPERFVLLRRFTRPGRERFRPAALLWADRLAPERFRLLPQLSWLIRNDPPLDVGIGPGLGDEAPLGSGPLGQLTATHPLAAPAMKQSKCQPATRPRPIVVTSWGSDYDRLTLVDCDGNIDVDALDRISALARIVGQQRPELPLPDDPTPSSDWPEEWVPGVRLLHPRLLWILQRINQAFPKRTVHLLSGYRRDAKESSPHRAGRALDLAVRGVPKERLFAFCMSLPDVGCGYYPFHPFVHVDVRPFGSPKSYWVDQSQPGETSEYVDGWPGVIESGALAGAGSE